MITSFLQKNISTIVIISLLLIIGFGAFSAFQSDTDQWVDWCSTSTSTSNGVTTYSALGCTYDISNEESAGDEFTVFVDALEGSTYPSPDEIDSSRNFYASIVQDYFEQEYSEYVHVADNCFSYTSGSRIEVCGSNNAVSQWQDDFGDETIYHEDDIINGQRGMELRISDVRPILEEVQEKSSCEASFNAETENDDWQNFNKNGEFVFTDSEEPACVFQTENINAVEMQSFDGDFHMTADFRETETVWEVENNECIDSEYPSNQVPTHSFDSEQECLDTITGNGGENDNNGEEDENGDDREFESFIDRMFFNFLETIGVL